MTEPLAPYTGTPTPATPEPAATTAPRLAVVHNRPLLIAVAAVAVVCAVLTFIGGEMFSGGPVEEIYRFGLIFDLVVVAVVLAVFTIVETVERPTKRRLDAPVYTRFSIFAIVAIVMSVVTVGAWWVGGGPEQFGYLLTGVRGRYMYHTGGVFVAGIPWALGLIFGGWGFRPKANTVTNVLALVAVGLGLFLAVVTTIASVVYGLGYSD